MPDATSIKNTNLAFTVNNCISSTKKKQNAVKFCTYLKYKIHQKKYRKSLLQCAKKRRRWYTHGLASNVAAIAMIHVGFKRNYRFQEAPLTMGTFRHPNEN